MRAAVIGIGSNSMRLLVIDIGLHARVLSERISTRLFLSLNARSNIPLEAAEQLAACVKELASHARDAGAQEVWVFSTSAMREAVNRREVCDVILKRTGLRVEIVDGRREAELSFIGAAEGTLSGVTDIGGGSTEIVIGEAGRVKASASLQLGASRLMRIRPITEEREARGVIAYCRDTLRSDRHCVRVMAAADRGCQWVGVGGTLTSLASLSIGADWNGGDAAHGYDFTADDVLVWIAHLAVLTPRERAALPGMQPQRADIIAHGLCILYAVMREFDIPRMSVSLYSNLDGYLKLHYGIRDPLL